jgi:hypothetical protein
MMSHSKNDITTRTDHRPDPTCRLRFSFFISALLTTLPFFASPIHAKNGGWDLEPYRIQITIAIDAPGGLAEQLASELPHYLQRRVDASLAPAWACDVRIATGVDRAKILGAITASDPPPPDVPKDKDKLLIAVIRTAPDGIELTAREFDRYVQRWSPPLRRNSRQDTYVPEQLFSLVYQTFSSLAQVELDPKDPHRVVLKPRGASLARSAGAAPLAKPGDVYAPVLRRTMRNGELEKKNGLQTVPWTYVEATEVKDNTIVGRFQSASRRPIIVRRQGRIEPVAIALHTDPDALTLKFRSRTAADKPLVGYEVFTQKLGDDALTPVGVSDTAGQITIPPGKTPLQFLLVKHGGQLFARIPVLAGEKQLIDIPLPDDDARLAAEASLAAVREDLVDVVARRNILISRARQKIEKKDYATAQELLRSLNDLPGRQQFKTTLDAAKRSLRSSDPQMQRRIDRLFDATDALLTQFLDISPINKVHDELREAQGKGGTKSAEASDAKKG